MTRLGRCGRRRKRKCDKEDVPQSSLPEFIQLKKWLKPPVHSKRGKSLNSSLKPCHFKDTGRGLQTMRRIRPGDVIVSLPMTHVITVHTVLASHVGSHIKKSMKKFTPQQILTIFLVVESCCAESPWQPYINSLPAVYSTPLYFSVEEMRLLNPQAQKQAASLRERFSRAFQAMRQFVEESAPGLWHCFTAERVRWAWATVDTRSVYLCTEPHPALALDPEESNVALAPFLDLLNHTDTAQVTAEVNLKSQSYEITTGDGFKKYDQVFISYGAHNNTKLLINYGFVLPQNVHNTYAFTVDKLVSCMPASCGHIERKRSILGEANLQRNLVCSVDGMSWSLSTALKIFVLPWELLFKWKLLLQGASLGDDIDTESDKVAAVMVEEALSEANRHLDAVKGQPQVTHHTLLLRLAQDDVDILTATLAHIRPSL